MRAQWMRGGGSTMLLAGLLAGAPTIPQVAHGQAVGGPLGATADGLIAAGRQLSPALRAASLETAAAAAKARGADALDDPTLSDSYQYYKDPGVFSAHSVMLTQSFPLWGKRDLRRQAALADVDAARGQELAAQNDLDEKIKIAFAQYYLAVRDLAVNHEISALARRMHAAAAARYGQGGGDQTAVILALGEETSAKTDAIRLQGDKQAVRARLNALIGRPGEAPLADPVRPRPMPAGQPALTRLVDRARELNPSLQAGHAAIAAARSRSSLADKAWYPDLTVGGGPMIQTNNQPVGFTATIGVNLPMPWGRAASGQDEAAAQLAASEQKYEATRLEIEGALGEALAQLQTARATDAILQREALPQARANFESVLANYSQGKGDLVAAITAAQQLHKVEITQLQAQLDAQVALAAIERLIGGNL